MSAYIFRDGQDTHFVPSRHSPDIQSGMEFSLILDLPIFPLYQPKNRVQRMHYRCLWQPGMFIRASVVAPFYCSVRKLFPFITVGVSSFLSRNPSNIQKAFRCVCVLLAPKNKVLPDRFPTSNFYAPLPIFIRCYLVSFPHHPFPHKKNESTLFS